MTLPNMYAQKSRYSISEFNFLSFQATHGNCEILTFQKFPLYSINSGYLAILEISRNFF